MIEEERIQKARDEIYETLSELKFSQEEAIMLLQNMSMWLYLLPRIDIEKKS